MQNTYNAYFEQDGEWFIGYCSEFPGANGMGKTLEECRENLADAIRLIIEDRAADMKKTIPTDALHEKIVV